MTEKTEKTNPIKEGLGVLSAFKEAIEETIADARERGDLTPERAKQAIRTALNRAQEAAGEARERLDVVPRKEFEQLRARVDELKMRVENLETSAAAARPTGADGSS